MKEWKCIQTKTELDYLLNGLIKEVGKYNIKRIFSGDAGVPQGNNSRIEVHLLDEPLYILFENNYCLKISFIDYSDIDIEYKEITEEELKNDGISPMGNEIDYLNGHWEIYGWDFDKNRNRIENSEHVVEIIDIKTEYTNIKNITSNGFEHEFEKWARGYEGCGIVVIPAGGDYFDSIKIILNNGIEISVCPEDAVADGYYDLIIEDTKNQITFSDINNR